MARRQTFVQDNDSHWYMIPSNRLDDFNRLVAEDESGEQIYEYYDQYRLYSGPHEITFTNPKGGVLK